MAERKRRRRRRTRAILAGLGTGIVAAFVYSYIATGGVLGDPPPPAAVCADVSQPGLELPPEAIPAGRWCGAIDRHLNVPLVGPLGFEAAFKSPQPPSDPLVPRPEYLIWTSDGCTAPVLGSGPFDFTLACNRHDFAWRNLKGLDGKGVLVWHIGNKDRADAGFLFDMRLKCAGLNPVFRFGCEATARIYYQAVHLNTSGVSGIDDAFDG